jgi:hypothetical protein
MNRLLVPTVATAALAVGLPAHAQERTASGWELSATVYAWALSLDGDAELAGIEADVDVPFSDILDELSFAGMGSIVARNGPYGFFVNPLFARTETDNDLVRVRDDTTILGLGALYRAVDWRQPDTAVGGPRGAQLDVLAGVRLTSLRLELNGRRGLPKFDDSKTWVDPTVGLGGRLQLTERWETFAEGDIGGFGVGSDITWDWFAGVGYGLGLFGRDAWLRAGYRMLHQDYKDGDFEWDVTYKGPFVGLTARF